MCWTEKWSRELATAVTVSTGEKPAFAYNPGLPSNRFVNCGASTSTYVFAWSAACGELHMVHELCWEFYMHGTSMRSKLCMQQSCGSWRTRMMTRALLRLFVEGPSLLENQFP